MGEHYTSIQADSESHLADACCLQVNRYSAQKGMSLLASVLLAAVPEEGFRTDTTSWWCWRLDALNSRISGRYPNINALHVSLGMKLSTTSNRTYTEDCS
jgi:hypothetical protein